MTETANGATFSPYQAAKELEGLGSFEEGLRQRTEGITWALWGFAGAGMFVSYGLAGATFGGSWPWWAYHLWAPWVGAGILLTHGVWRSAALVAPRIADEPRGVRYYWAFWMAFMLAVWAIAVLFSPPLKVPVLIMLALGTAGLVSGALNLPGSTRAGRTVALAANAVVLAAAFGLAVAGASNAWATAAGAIVVGGAWVVGGLSLMFRG